MYPGVLHGTHDHGHVYHVGHPGYTLPHPAQHGYVSGMLLVSAARHWAQAGRLCMRGHSWPAEARGWPAVATPAGRPTAGQLSDGIQGGDRIEPGGPKDHPMGPQDPPEGVLGPAGGVSWGPPRGVPGPIRGGSWDPPRGVPGPPEVVLGPVRGGPGTHPEVSQDPSEGVLGPIRRCPRTRPRGPGTRPEVPQDPSRRC